MDLSLPQRLLQIAEVSIRSGEFSNFDPNPQPEPYPPEGVVFGVVVVVAATSDAAPCETDDAELWTAPAAGRCGSVTSM